MVGRTAVVGMEIIRRQRGDGSMRACIMDRITVGGRRMGGERQGVGGAMDREL